MTGVQPLLGPTGALQNLSGYWRAGEHGGIVRLWHWPRLGGVWSMSAKPCSEELSGVVDRLDDCWRIRAKFGRMGFFLGEASGAGDVINWNGGSLWHRVEVVALQPSQRISRLKSALLCMRVLCWGARRTFCACLRVLCLVVRCKCCVCRVLCRVVFFLVSVVLRWVSLVKAILLPYSVYVVLAFLAIFGGVKFLLRQVGADTIQNNSVGAWFVCVILSGFIVLYIIHDLLPRSRNRSIRVRIIQWCLFTEWCAIVFLEILDGPAVVGQLDLCIGNETGHWSGNTTGGFGYLVACFLNETNIWIDMAIVDFARFALHTGNETGNSTSNIPGNFSNATTIVDNSTQLSPEVLRVVSGLQWTSAAAFAVAILFVFLRYLRQLELDARTRQEDPLSWPGVGRLEDGQERDLVINQFNEDCRTGRLRGGILEIYTITGERWAENFQERAQSLMEEARPPIDCRSVPVFCGVRRLYHGAPSCSVKSICASGFCLPRTSPMRPLMYGGGLYFTDVPEKAWQFTGDTRYVLVCDVALGRPKPMKKAHTAFSLEVLRMPSLEGVVYDSVLGEDVMRGGVLRYREFVVYREEQVLPRYLLAITERAA